MSKVSATGLYIDLPVMPHPRINQREERCARGERRNRRLRPPPKLTRLLPASNHRRQQIDKVGGAFMMLAKHARPRHHFAHHQPHHVGMPRSAFGQHLERHADSCGRASAIGSDSSRQFIVGALAVFDEQSFLGWKMQKKRRACDVGGVADIVDRNRIETTP